ncbi:hypothetical protein MNB_SV-15-833 [hydrothermal vent metagenome]|uniref:Uncharacterized protein n=1 Tax=hydrothermal vent metagenome TaxID=652676 RepID=A0A1W1EKA5_9ZZZZ
MKFFADKMEALDNFFAGKSSSESYMIIVGVAGSIAFVAYMIFLPYATSEFETSKARKIAIKKSINEQKSYLTTITINGDRDFYVKQHNRDIAQKKNAIANYKAKIKFVNLNLEQLSDMLFNKRSWSRFIDSISAKSDEHDLMLREITSEYVDNNGSFGHVLKVGISCKGDYNGIVQFINQLEQNVLVTDVYDIHIYSDTNTSYALSDINISVWGVNH